MPIDINDAQFDALLDKVCTVQCIDTTVTDNTYGHKPEDYVDVATGVACRLSTLTSRGKDREGEARFATDQFKVYMRNRTLTAKHRLVINAVVYKIIAPPVDPSGAGHHLEVLVERLIP